MLLVIINSVCDKELMCAANRCIEFVVDNDTRGNSQ